jgi:hypothetical protein
MSWVSIKSEVYTTMNIHEVEASRLRAEYENASQAYAGICRTLDESGKKREELERTLKNAAMLIVRLARRLHDKDELREKAFDFLERNGLYASPLRRK